MLSALLLDIKRVAGRQTSNTSAIGAAVKVVVLFRAIAKAAVAKFRIRASAKALIGTAIGAALEITVGAAIKAQIGTITEVAR